MAQERIEVVSIVDRVYESLRGRIVAGGIPQGERLRQEALAEELGVSRTPLREALRRLASEGLVELEPNRGARVPEVSTGDMLAGYEARLVVEPGAARLAASRAGPGDVAVLRHAIAAHRRARSVAELFDANRAFHVALVRAAGNDQLTRFADLLWITGLGAAVVQRQAESSDSAVNDPDEHAAIADAVAAHDGAAAEDRTRSHIAAAFARFATRTDPS